MSVPVLATPVEPTKFPVSVDVMSTIKSTKQYISSVKIVDTYGNLVAVNGKWEKEFNHLISDSDTKATNIKTVNATRQGYKPISFKLSRPQDNTIVVEPPIVTQVTIGKVIIPDGLPKDNWWIKLQKPNTYTEDVVIKVKPDGTFNFVNLQDGAYEVEIFRGTHFDSFSKDVSGCNWDRTHTAKLENLDINGNINKTFDITNSVVDAVSFDDYFTNTIDYSNPQKYLQVTSHLELDDATKKFADEQVPEIADVKSLEKAISIIRNKFKFNFDVNKTDLYMSAKEIIKQGYLTGCSQTATIFQAILEYKGIPTTVVSCISVGWANDVQAGKQSPHLIVGHMYVEAFIGGNWILVDPTGGTVFKDYSSNDINIYSMKDSENTRFYPVVKANDLSALISHENQYALTYLAQKADLNKLNNISEIYPSLTVSIFE